MNYRVPINQAKSQFPEYDFIAALTPSVQKAAFHVRDNAGRDLCLKLIAPTYSVDRLNREIETLHSALAEIADDPDAHAQSEPAPPELVSERVH